MEIIVAKNAGFCFGVKRAVEMAEKALDGGEKIYCLGELIHNRQVIERLEQKGLVIVSDPDEVPAGGTLLIRSHGAGPEVAEKITAKGGKVLDTTCPFVRRAQLVAKKFQEENYSVVICGDPAHAEVIGINAWANNAATIVNDPAQVKDLELKDPVGVLSQTTQKIKLLKETVDALLDHNKRIMIENTICSDSATKQAEVSALAETVDAMVVIGGKHSSNTGKLVQLSQAKNIPTYHIETADELQPEWFAKTTKVGVAAGASTARFLIDAVVDKLENL